MSNSLSALTLLKELPQCSKPGATQAIAGSTCGYDLACLCVDDNFLNTLKNLIISECGQVKNGTQNSVNVAKDLCTQAIPASTMTTRQTEIIVGMAVLTFVSLFAVIIRIISRCIGRLRFWWDDWFIFFAEVITLAENANSWIAIPLGYGRHFITLDTSQVTAFGKLFFETQILFNIAITATKLSILALYFRLFRKEKFRVVCIALGLFNIGWCIAVTFMIVFGCQPIEYSWNKSIDGYCSLDTKTTSFVGTVTNVITDLMVLCAPIPVLWGLQLPKKKKLMIIGIFLLGGFACVASIVRIPFLATLNTPDPTWSSTQAGMFVMLELNIGVLSACCPTFWPLFRWIGPRLKSRLSGFSSTMRGARSGGSSESTPYESRIFSKMLLNECHEEYSQAYPREYSQAYQSVGDTKTVKENPVSMISAESDKGPRISRSAQAVRRLKEVVGMNTQKRPYESFFDWGIPASAWLGEYDVSEYYDPNEHWPPSRWRASHQDMLPAPLRSRQDLQASMSWNADHLNPSTPSTSKSRPNTYPKSTIRSKKWNGRAINFVDLLRFKKAGTRTSQRDSLDLEASLDEAPWRWSEPCNTPMYPIKKPAASEGKQEDKEREEEVEEEEKKSEVEEIQRTHSPNSWRKDLRKSRLLEAYPPPPPPPVHTPSISTLKLDAESMYAQSTHGRSTRRETVHWPAYTPSVYSTDGMSVYGKKGIQSWAGNVQNLYREKDSGEKKLLAVKVRGDSLIGVYGHE